MPHLSACSHCEVRSSGLIFSAQTLFRRLSSTPVGSLKRGLRGVGTISPIAAALLLAGGSGASAQTPAPALQSGWSQLSPATAPPERMGTALAYDAAHAQVVLFGGFGYSTVLNDTWLWNGSNWTQANPANSPSARSAQAMAYDAATGQVVLFGGATAPPNSTRLADTWLWNGSNWTQAAPANNPPARNGASMVYDASSGQVVLFGGIDANGNVLGDTWLWNGSNWTQATPATSPLGRFGASMAYDAALGEAILFGGDDVNGNIDNDTWAWNGSIWTQLTPANSPPARDDQAMEYDAVSGQVVVFGGYNGSAYLNDTWVWDGTNWTQQSPAASPAARGAAATAWDAAEGQVVLFGGFVTGSDFSDTWTWGTPQNFGNVSVCAPGTAATSTCSATVAFTYTLPATTTFGTPQVVTQGAAGLDFSLGSGSTCTGTMNAGNSCRVVVTFAPQAPGLREGAVNLVNDSGTLLTSTPVYGNGEAPEIAFAPAPAVNGVSGVGVPTGTAVLSGPLGVTTDAQGNLYLANTGESNVLKVASAGTVSTVGYGFVAPQSLAVDGAGDLFVADTGLNPPNGEVVEIPAGCTTSACQVAVYAPVVHPSPAGVAVDGLGNLYIADPVAGVLELPAGCASAACQVSVGSGWSQPEGVAVDAAGDLFVADTGLKEIVKIPAGCTSAGCQTIVGSGWSAPRSVAVDAAGDIFVADSELDGGSGGVEEVPAGCTSSSCQALLFTGLSYGVTTNAAGEIFISEQSPATQILQINQSEPPLLSFETTYVGSISNPQYFTVLNAGNQPLVNSAIGLTSAFQITNLNGNPPGCNVNFTLLPGQGCNLTIDFVPVVPGNISDPATLQDNSLNGDDATQTFNLTGTALEPSETLTVTGPGAGSGTVVSNPTGIDCSFVGSTASGTCSASFTGGSIVSLEETPTGGSTFTSWAGACAYAAGNEICNVTVSPFVTASAVFAPPTDTISVTELGNGAGTVTSGPAGINCSQSGGVSSGTCSANFAAGSQLTLTATPVAGAKFMGWGGACASAGTSPACTVAAIAGMNVSATFSQQSFGAVNVCAQGETTPAPCSATLAETFNIPANTTVGAIQVVTQGATGLDFSVASGSTCTGTFAAASSCSVNVAFTPIAAGLRLGAVNLYDNNGNLLSSLPVYGVGQAPAIAFSPGIQTTLNTASYALNQPKGVTLDAAGNLYVADTYNARVLKVGPGGIQTVGYGLAFPQGLAVDGAGDLYIADNNLNEVVEVPAGCASSSCQKVVGSGLESQLGVAVDGAGDLFMGDFLDGEVAELPANGGVQTVVYSPGAGSNPVGLAVDAAGDLFVADFGLHRVEEVPAGCASSSCWKTVGTGWSEPESVAVDAAGDVVVTDIGLNEVVEVPAGCTSSACQFVVSTVNAYNATMDSQGDIFIVETGSNQVVEVNHLLPPSLSYALTNVGSTSADSPQAVSIQNVGNQPLSGTLALNLGTSFAENAGSTCDSFTLIPGATCSESFSFTPQSTGYQTGTADFSDNTRNLDPAVVLQTVNLSGSGGLNGQPVGVAVPNVVGLAQATATSTIAGTGLALGSVSTGSSSVVPSGSVIASNPSAGTMVTPGSAVRLLVSTGEAPPAVPDPLALLNNYFVTGDYAAGGVTLRGTGVNGMATGTITIPDSTTSPGSQGVPDGADLIDGYLYWETLENTSTPSGNLGAFDGYSIVGQQIGSDIPYTDGPLSGTLRMYRADVNVYFPVAGNGSGVRRGSGAFTVSLPDSGGSGLPLTEGASLVVIYRVMSPNFPLKSVVIYDGAAIPASSTNQNMLGFYDALGGAAGESTTVSYSGGTWNNSSTSVTLAAHASQYAAPLNADNAYAAVILSTPVTNSDHDGILDAWKAGPPAGDFYAGQPGYYDVKTGDWVSLPGAVHGEKDLFVQLDYMCGAVLADGTCDPNQENLFPAPDAQGHDPLAMVKQAFAAEGIALHLEIGNAVPETTCTDNTSTNPPQLCEFPSEPGVIGWKDSLEFSKLLPRNLASCAAGGDCSPRFAYGQKDSYHYVLFGHSLAVPAWNTRFNTLISIQVANGVTTLVTTDRGSGINACPSRITISGVLGDPGLNGVYNTQSCPDTKTMIVDTPGVPNWSYPNATMPEPVIGITSGTVTSISGYSDLGGQDSAVTLGLWETDPGQNMSKRANVIAGTLLHEIGHTLGLTHGGLYYDTPGSYVPTFGQNCKPNYQSVMNYLFQLDGLGPAGAIAYSNQTLETIAEPTLGSVTSLTDTSGNPAAFSTSTWYSSTQPSSGESAATLHCDGTPLQGDTGYVISGPIDPITPAWVNGQDISFDQVAATATAPATGPSMLGYNDWANVDLRQVGATGAEYASLAGVLSFGTSAAPLNIAAGGNVTLGSGGSVAVGSGGTVTLGSGGNVTLGSGGTIALGSGGTVTLGSGGNVTLGSGGTITLGSGGTVTLGSGGNVTLGSGGTITLGSGGTVTLGSGGNVTLGSGGTIALGSGGTVTIPGTGGSYTLPGGGGTVTLGSGGNVTLGSGGNVTLGSGGTIAMGSGGNVTLGSGGNVTLGSGGTITLGSGGNVTLGSGGNVTLGSGGTITLGSGGTVTLGSGGNVTLGSGGTVTLGSGGTVTLGSGGTIALGSGGNVTLGSGGTIALGSGGTVTLGSGGTVTLGSGGTITLGSGGAPIPISAGGSYILPSGGGTIALGSGGTVTLGSGGNVTLGSGGTITMGSGGTVTMGSGGTVTLGSGGVDEPGSGGVIAMGSGGTIALGSGGTVTMGSGGADTTELTYDTANSIVRPPVSPTETPLASTVVVSWTAPAFGVVATYTVSRSSDGGAPVVIGSVSGVNGNPPATMFIDTNPDLTAKTVVYTITTTLVPDQNTSTQRQSAPSPPAVMTNDQTIVPGSVPSSVVLSSTPVAVTATAETNGSANGLEVNFTAAGSCSISSQTIDSSTGISSASVALNSTGSCTITASQPGFIPTQSGQTGFNAAAPVTQSFTILPQGSNTQAQTITFGALQNVEYGATFAVSASSSSGLPVSFTASGPCTVAGATTGVGLCTITASAPASNNYSAASVTQSFSVYPAVITVTANSLTSVYGSPLPTLTYAYTGLVNNDSASAISGMPALSTTATAGSAPGSYPITVSTGSLAATNYSFLYVGGTLTMQPAPLTITAGTGTMVYGGIVPAITATFSGFANGDTQASLSPQPSCGTSATSLSPVGSYPTVCSGAADPNYTITYVPGTLTILPAVSSTSLVSSTNGTSNYGQLVTITPTVSGTPVPPGIDSVLYSYTNSTVNGGASVPLGSVPLSQGYSTFLLPPGSNTVTATFDGDGSDPNYQPSSASVTQVVAAVPVAYISPSSVTFPNTDVGSTSTSISVLLTNIGAAPLNVTGVHIVSGDSGPADFVVQSSTCGGTLQPWQTPVGPMRVDHGSAAAAAPPAASTSTVSVDASCVVTLAFAPNAKQDEGVRTGTLVFTDNDGGQTGATDSIALTGSALSSISASFPAPPMQSIPAGDYIWFNSELSVQGPLDPMGNPLKMNTDEVQVMVTNGSISFTNPANGTTTTIPVPDALIQFVPGLTQASTTFDAANNRWVTQVPMNDPATGRPQFIVPGNIFVTGVPYLVPAAISQGASGPHGMPAFAQNVTWSAEFTTDTPGVRLNWQWGAAVYNPCFGNQPTSSNPTCAGDSLNLANLDVLGVNSADSGKCPIAHENSYNAGTPYSFINDLVTSGPPLRGTGPSDLYTGQASPMAGVVPAVTPVNFSPSPLVFMPVQAGQSSSPMTLTITNENESLPFNISGVGLNGSNASDFAITGTSCTNASGAATFSANSVGALTLAPAGAGANSCTVTLVFTPGDLGSRTASLLFTYATPPGMAPNETPPPQTVNLYGTGAGGTNPIVGLSAVSLNFRNQEQGTTSPGQTVMLVNAGGGALTINSIAASGEFGESRTCPAYPATLPGGASCTISVWFQPLATSTGPRTGAITIIDNNNGVAGSMQTISLTGQASP